MNFYKSVALAYVAAMIWGEVLFYFDGKVIPRVEDYFRRRRAAIVDQQAAKSHDPDGRGTSRQ